jgi:hypothetical protein
LPIVIKDETANAVVLTIDNLGRLAFGDGTPIDMVTLNGYGIIDSEGYIVHGLGSSAVIPASGTLDLRIGESAQILTIPGVMPIIALDTSYPARHYSVNPVTGVLVTTTTPTPVHTAEPDPGSFRIMNTNTSSVDLVAYPEYDHVINTPGPVNYRWI